MDYRTINKNRADEILAAIDRGYFSDSKIPIGNIKAPEVWNSELLDRLKIEPKSGDPIITVTGNSAVDDLIKLNEKYPDSKIGLLNFASSHSPGGGFIRGAMAQEEALCQASTLYIQLKGSGLYELNKFARDGIYTDNMAVSETKFLRDSKYMWLRKAVTAAVVTSAAVNVGRVDRGRENLVAPAMKGRMEKIIKLFAESGCDVLILGAFGCGVFGNDPGFIAEQWKTLTDKYGGYFTEICFSVMSFRDKTNFNVFRKTFGE